MAKPEQNLWKRVRPQLAPWGHFTRIENESGAGQPDVHFAIGGRVGWLELKVWPRELERSQIVWASEYARCGGWVRVLVTVETSTMSDLFLLPVETYDLLHTSRLAKTMPEIADWVHSRDGWPALRNRLGA